MGFLLAGRTLAAGFAALFLNIPVGGIAGLITGAAILAAAFLSGKKPSVISLSIRNDTEKLTEK